jgi:hypothetical protein
MISLLVRFADALARNMSSLIINGLLLALVSTSAVIATNEIAKVTPIEFCSVFSKIRFL